MLEALSEGLVLGFGVSVPFGPVNLLILSYALSSFKRGFALGLGAMSADVLYLMLLSFGLLTFLQNEFFQQVLALFGFCFLSYIAILLLKSKGKDLQIQSQNESKNVLSSYAKGFGLNLLNPYVVGFWLSVSSLISGADQGLWLIFGLIFAILVWIFSLSFFAFKFTHFFNARLIRIINIISALIMLYFALALVYKGFFA